ncbi:unnamed protein product [Trichogramma brassicae]|uniref:Uncharacterized protein n=1 Tax=Trichogramma brassicae TaxID=86971 RepID=A0A6H5HU91_9HYME|nr:unnamed protein product [Trichogramma brassicae]
MVKTQVNKDAERSNWTLYGIRQVTTPRYWAAHEYGREVQQDQLKQTIALFVGATIATGTIGTYTELRSCH